MPVKVLIKFAIAVLLAVAIGASLYAFEGRLTAAMCDNTVFAESESPDGKWKAVVFGRNCGATDSISTQISILPMSVDLPNKGGNICMVSVFPKVELRWAGNNELVITHRRGAKFFNAVQSFYGVSIRYEEQAQHSSAVSFNQPSRRQADFSSSLLIARRGRRFSSPGPFAGRLF